MKTSYQYKVKPTALQAEKIDKTLEMLCFQYNYLLAQRFDWYEMNRCPVDRCSLICHLPELKEQPNYYNQKATLVQLKVDRPWYKEIHSQVLQEVPKKVELAFDRWIKGDVNGKKSGRPRFKGKGQYKTFTYTQFKRHHFVNNKITLSKIGDIKVIVHRSIPKGFDIKTVSVTKKADGYYVTLSLNDKTVPTIKPDFNPDKIVGIDVGLIDFYVASDDSRIAAPKHLRKAERKLKSAQRKVSRRNKSSNRRKKAIQKLGKQHKKVADTRKDFHFKIAKALLDKYDVIAVEKLNIKRLAKTRLAKSVNDAGWGQFVTILSNKAENAGLRLIAINPNGTSQECSSCGQKVKKLLSQRKHNCPNCKVSLCRDLNAAINIKNRGAHGLKAQSMSS
ncbi:IS200/IS605 family element transposase accessory protein TnpB [Nostoc edaphicum CCNP1411]|uniref:IS200/IS605 family element transposase accessory protein TnpB n=1 Tax=Nostoc edaphicum CCNP1411 TaxID=1472755 RepID=A0A7D7LH73_9NOSO|nr:RNA-guided endonuclease TnpB family protein [Nostoc edaphicum]QMS90612.1 IS200/IS605 family element transposase accessory protein TnpB [Nostoc edaphicum CCNP1411]